ncbi:sphingomyelin phosphodiesterase [Streptomyces sp. SID13031]|uniref:sphingomyelin phosphodiesterase n=1 Tax=Streptomyces sp. SID13031 TaxID=2706046 RepID=UPI0013CBAF74|nr:sphingomyelin phosphodiesterase [Streptomyces sp. SID13031]NEA37352.1 sphingomyelin phosphodiesterase [Streptomyces sp. SID13031]
MTYNLMLLPSGLTDWEPDLRARLVGDSAVLRGSDVLVLTELFDNSATDDYLFPRLAPHHPYRTPVVGRSTSGWNRTTGGYIGTPFEDGGVAIASKWPIRHRAQHIFTDGCGADWWSSKGFAYVILDVAGTRVHLIGTHLQANDSSCDPGEPASVRARQLATINSYLRALTIPAAEPVLIAGDLNIRYGSSEYSRMLSLLSADGPTRLLGQQASYDPATNSIAAYRSPGGSPSRLDYVLPRRGHRTPTFGWSNTITPTHSAPFTMRGRTFTDFSDHYSVIGRPAN